MKGMVYVSPDGLKTVRTLPGWVQRGLAFVSQKPPSKPRKRVLKR
jgi:hypothetical protein